MKMKKVEVNIRIDTKPQNVIEAFTNPTMLKEWWGVEKTLIELRQGGLYTLAWNISEDGIGYVSTGIINQYEPNGVLEISNFVYLTPDKSFLGPMRLIVQAVECNRESDVYLCQDGYRTGGDWGWYYDAVKGAWPLVMENFKNYLEK